MNKQKKKARDVIIKTNRETIEEELRENRDPLHDDFWPVSNYPVDIIPGKSKLHLSDGKNKVASFTIEGKGTRIWRGRTKKVLLLKKNSARREKGTVRKRLASMGGFTYLD